MAVAAFINILILINEKDGLEMMVGQIQCSPKSSGQGQVTQVTWATVHG